MKVLILGAAGMLGHRMLRTFQSSGLETWATLRKSKSHYRNFEFLQSEQIIDGVDVLAPGELQKTLSSLKPSWVINCIGLTLRKESAVDARANIKLNALLPHEIEFWCRTNGAKLVHYSTDCVFSGALGNYSEDSKKDAYDVYGQSKSLGEVVDSKAALTLRSSIIGQEIEGCTELLSWFLSQNGKTVKGFTKAMYSGVTTNHMADLTLRIIKEKPDIFGLLQVASEPISKFELLRLINTKFAKRYFHAEVLPDEKSAANKTLLETKFRGLTGWSTPSWNSMIESLENDADFYTQLRG